MRCEDFLFEAVRNSYEAGAKHVEVSWSPCGDVARAVITDDGVFTCTGDCFSAGVSTKGEGRGEGLYLLKCAHPDAEIVRKDGLTRLTFSCPDEDVELLSVVPFILSSGVDRFIYSGEVFERSVLEELYGNAFSSGFIAGVKKHLREHGIR